MTLDCSEEVGGQSERLEQAQATTAFDQRSSTPANSTFSDPFSLAFIVLTSLPHTSHPLPSHFPLTAVSHQRIADTTAFFSLLVYRIVSSRLCSSSALPLFILSSSTPLSHHHHLIPIVVNVAAPCPQAPPHRPCCQTRYPQP